MWHSWETYAHTKKTMLSMLAPWPLEILMSLHRTMSPEEGSHVEQSAAEIETAVQ